MRTAMVVTWTHPIAGREQKALAFSAEVMQFWGKQAALGLCSAPEIYFAESGSGMWIIVGDRDTLLQIHDSDEARLLMMKGELLLEQFKVDFFYAGDAAADYLRRYHAALGTIS